MSILYTEKDMQKMYNNGRSNGIKDTFFAIGSFVLFTIIIYIIAII